MTEGGIAEGLNHAIKQSAGAGGVSARERIPLSALTPDAITR
jgi:hypothetical protein